MIVSFPFTFTFSVLGVPNPFSSGYSQHSRPSSGQQALPVPREYRPFLDTQNLPLNRSTALPAPSCSSPPSRPKNLKRGWGLERAETTDSQSSTTLVSTSGYHGSPSNEFVGVSDVHDEDLDPPCKKRRGLAGSIVSTAVNAALIGTAVGLTVYRLWRGHGKETHAVEALDTASSDSENGSSLPPPPPYQEREWSLVSHPVESALPPPLASAGSGTIVAGAIATPTTPRRKILHRSGKRIRRTRVLRPQTNLSPERAGPSSYIHAEPDFEQDRENNGDDQMNWIQDRLAQLIEEGKRALSREVVVMSDAKEDEVDDGSSAWEEENDYHHHHQSASSTRRLGSLRRVTKRSRAQNSFYGSWDNSDQSLTNTIHAPTTPKRTHKKFSSADAIISREDENAWESPELRETMRLARENIMAGRRMS